MEPATQSPLFADMLGLLKKFEWEYCRANGKYFCPWCNEYEYDGHEPDCHLQSTIALAEEHLNDSR
jgi:hypothetical protein